MTDALRSRIGRAAIALARDSGGSLDSGNLILIDLDELLDAVLRIVNEHRGGTPLYELDLSMRIHNALKAAGIRSIEQLAAWDREQLLDTRNLGQTSITEIQQALAARGLALGTCPAPAAPVPDFFQAGHTYIQAKPFTAPELLTVFRCIVVTDFPGRDDGAGPLAFGFATPAHPGDRWSIYVCRQAIWTDGWTEYDQTNSEASA